MKHTKMNSWLLRLQIYYSKKKKKFLLFNNRYDGRQKVMTFLIKKYTQYKNVNIPKWTQMYENYIVVWS